MTINSDIIQFKELDIICQSFEKGSAKGTGAKHMPIEWMDAIAQRSKLALVIARKHCEEKL